jgi:hypothetical protein
MCGVKVLPLTEEGRLPSLEDNFWYHHLLLRCGNRLQRVINNHQKWSASAF